MSKYLALSIKIEDGEPTLRVERVDMRVAFVKTCELCQETGLPVYRPYGHPDAALFINDETMAPHDVIEALWKHFLDMTKKMHLPSTTDDEVGF